MGIRAQVRRDETGLLSGVSLICATEARYAPIISSNRIHEYFDPNRERLLRAARRFEGVFGAFGLIRLDYESAEWAWHWSTREDPTPRLHFSYSSGSCPAPVRRSPVELNVLASLTALSMLEVNEARALTLNLFREGEWHFHEWRYIDAIRNYYLAIEHECADGKTGKRQTISALRDSPAFRQGVDGARAVVDFSVRWGDISSEDAATLLGSSAYEDLAEWCFGLRGSLMHASRRRQLQQKWHPSDHMFHKRDAIILRAICHGVAVYAMEKLTFEPN